MYFAKKKYGLLLILIISNNLISCKSAKEIASQNNEVVQELSASAIDACTIIGKIISIIEETDSSNINSPCFKVPCWANVRVEDVLHCGSRFAASISAGEEIKMFFVYTLSPSTANLFPNLEKRYPGLEKNDYFKANISCRFQPGEGETKWIVYEYILQIK